MEIAIAITTAPRQEPTFARALQSLRASGFNEVVRVVAEPGTNTTAEVARLRDARTIVRENRTQRGCFRNWKRTLEYLVSETEASWLMIVQDDAIWGQGSAEIVRAMLRERQEHRTGFVSPYASVQNLTKESRDGWSETRAGWGFWGALALCMKRVAAEDLLQHERFRKHAKNRAVDAVVAASMLDLKRPSFVHVPSLVDHIGITSTIDARRVMTPGRRGHRFGAGSTTGRR